MNKYISSVLICAPILAIIISISFEKPEIEIPAIEDTQEVEDAPVIEEPVNTYNGVYSFVYTRRYYYLDGIDNYSLNQNGLGLPTGCEITAYTIATRYKGYDVDVYDAINNFLPQGAIANSNPYEVYVGSPYDGGSYGCYANVITQVAGSMGVPHINYSGTSFQNVIEELEAGRPVIFWGTMNMCPTQWNSSSWYCPDGTYISWKGCEHCLVLCGFNLDEGVFYFSDPLKGYICSYDMEISYTRWLEQGEQCVVIY